MKRREREIMKGKIKETERGMDKIQIWSLIDTGRKTRTRGKEGSVRKRCDLLVRSKETM